MKCVPSKPPKQMWIGFLGTTLSPWRENLKRTGVDRPSAICKIVQPLDISSVSRTQNCVLRGLGQSLNKQKTLISTFEEMRVFAYGAP